MLRNRSQLNQRRGTYRTRKDDNHVNPSKQRLQLSLAAMVESTPKMFLGSVPKATSPYRG